MSLHSEFLFPSVESAQRATDEGGWYAYLIDGLDVQRLHNVMGKPEGYGWWELGSANATQLAPITFHGIDANLATARATFSVPAVEVGEYYVMFCDTGCVNGMGDVVPTQIDVVATAAVAQLRRDVDRYQLKLHDARALALRASTKATSALTHAERAQEDSARYFTALSAMRRSAASEPAPGDSGTLGGWAAALLILLGAALWEVGLRLRGWTSTFLPSSKTS
jgi:hypothetical protein